MRIADMFFCNVDCVWCILIIDVHNISSMSSSYPVLVFMVLRLSRTPG